MPLRSELRFYLVVTAVAVTALACSDPQDSESQDLVADLDGRQVTVAVENAYLPFSYINAASGEAEGWDYDILAELCSRLNCEPVFVPIPWEPTLETVGRGDIDMAANGIVIKADRDLIVDFADSYGSARQYLFVRAEEDRFSGAHELLDGDYVVAAQVNTVNSDKAIALVGEDNVATFAFLEEAMAAVVSGEADAFVHMLKDGQKLAGPYADEVRIGR